MAQRQKHVQHLVHWHSGVASWFGCSSSTSPVREGDLARYPVDRDADLAACDVGKKNDGAFGAGVEPLPVDHAIGVGTFVPNNAVIIHGAGLQRISMAIQ